MKYLRTIERPETGKTEYYEIPVSVIETEQQFLNVTENGKLSYECFQKLINFETFMPEMIIRIKDNKLKFPTPTYYRVSFQIIYNLEQRGYTFTEIKHE